jgi:hypothetical protein
MGFLSLLFDSPARSSYIFCALEIGSRVLLSFRRIGKRVQIPRCRATVSEEIAPGHWSFRSGKARGKFFRIVE